MLWKDLFMIDAEKKASVNNAHRLSHWAADPKASLPRACGFDSTGGSTGFQARAPTL